MKTKIFSKSKKLLISCNLLIFIFISMISVNASDFDGSFNAATYNIGALPWPAYSFGTAGNPDGRVQLIGQRLQPFDIIGIQEQFSLIRDFREGTRHPYYSRNVHLYSGGSGIDLLSKFPMSKTVRVEFDDRPFYVPKGFSKNTVTIYPGVLIDVYNTHTGDEDDTIYSQLEQLGAYIKNNSPADRAVIVLGDFNTYLNTPSKPLKALVMDQNNLKNARHVYHNLPDDTTTWEPVDKVLFRSGADIELTIKKY